MSMSTQIPTISYEVLERQIIACVNSKNPTYEFTKLVAWIMFRINDSSLPMDVRRRLAGQWNGCMASILPQWFGGDWGSWFGFVVANFELYCAMHQEMSTNAALYESAWAYI